MAKYDLAITNGAVVIPNYGTQHCDIGIRDGHIAVISDSIDSIEADQVINAKNHVVFPGAVDSHFHLGIYNPLEEDVRNETAAALVGGVTTVISYFRTGQNYLNKTGPYRKIFPEVLEATSGNSATDFGYHIAIMTEEQLGEVDWLIDQQGVSSFKIYMFYMGLNLAGDSTHANDYILSQNYDMGHMYLLMSRVAQAAKRHTKQGRISLSIHCENAGLIRAFTKITQQAGFTGLEAWHKARPGLTERLSISEASLLADSTECPVNLLHLSGQEAIEAAIEAKRFYPKLDITMETTLHHLALNYLTAGKGIGGKVNPPIRTDADREALWEAIRTGNIHTVVSDHACCREEQKGNDLWSAIPGFGGTSLIYPYLISEGYHKRGLSLSRIAELVSANPAKAFGLYPKKGAISVGSDADFAIVDMEKEHVVTPNLLKSGQDFTPFAGIKIKGWPQTTILRGNIVMRDGEVVESRYGEYTKRPVSLHTNN